MGGGGGGAVNMSFGQVFFIIFGDKKNLYVAPWKPIRDKKKKKKISLFAKTLSLDLCSSQGVNWRGEGTDETTEDYRVFIDHTTRLMERALCENLDIFIDYEGKGDGEGEGWVRSLLR